jgi:hypothetical protein
MFLFYDFVTKELNILPSENFNKTIELTNYNFNTYINETELEMESDMINISNMDDFYTMVREYKEINKKTYRFVDMFKNKYKVIKTIYSNNQNNYTLYQFICNE